MSDLHGWITQQIDRTEAVARDATPGPWITHDHDDQVGMLEVRTVHEADIMIGYVADVATVDAHHIVRHDPASVLRRCAADRKILAIHAPAGGKWEPYACLGCGDDSEYGALVEHTNDCETLLALAEGYGLTEEQRAVLDRPEPERLASQSTVPNALADAYMKAITSVLLGTRPVEPSPKEKAIRILDPELKKIPGYLPTTEEQQ